MSDVILLILFGLWGLVVGGAYFALVRRTARQLATGQIHLGGLVGAFGMRLLLFAPGAVIAARFSLLALAAYMAGFIASRFVAVVLGGARRAS